jgi:hypothetical protein
METCLYDLLRDRLALIGRVPFRFSREDTRRLGSATCFYPNRIGFLVKSASRDNLQKSCTINGAKYRAVSARAEIRHLHRRELVSIAVRFFRLQVVARCTSLCIYTSDNERAGEKFRETAQSRLDVFRCVLNSVPGNGEILFRYSNVVANLRRASPTESPFSLKAEQRIL